MADKEILAVEIDDSEFSAFKRKFDEYEAAVKTLPAQWQRSSAEISVHRTNFEKIVASAGNIYRSMELATISQSASSRVIEATELAWAGIGKRGKLFRSDIVHATQSLMRWTKLTAVFSGLLGAGGLFGINRMAASVAGQRTSAAGLGVTYGEQASFLVNFGRLGNAEGILQGFSEAETNVSKKYALRQYLGHAESGDPAKDFAEGLGRFKDFVDKTPQELLGPMLQRFGYEKLGIGIETARIIKGTSRSELMGLISGYGADLASRLGLPPDVAKKWIDFSTKIEKAGEDIDTIFWKKTAKLAKPLEHLSESFINLVDNLLKDGGPISGWIKDLGKGIRTFADELGSGAVQAKASEIGQKIADIVRLFDAILAKAPEKIAVLAGIGAAARVGGIATAIGGGLARSGAIGTLGATGAAAGALGATVYPQPLNEGEDERARQKRFHQGSSEEGGATVPEPPHRHGPSATGNRRPMPTGVFPEKVPAKPGDLSDKSAILMRGKGEPTPLEVIHGSTKGVDKRLMDAVAAGAADLPPGYKVKIFSGFRPGDRGAHGRGQAIDVEIVDPKGNVITSRGEDKSGMYRHLAKATREEMKAKYPDLAAHKLAWGGSFGTQKGGGGVSDLMHFDIMGRRGGIRASHYPQVQDLGPLSLRERTLSRYLGHRDKQDRRASFGHLGHHPATIGRAEKTLTIHDNTGGLVTVVPH